MIEAEQTLEQGGKVARAKTEGLFGPGAEQQMKPVQVGRFATAVEPVEGYPGRDLGRSMKGSGQVER